jgi:hypothetical protein
MGQHLFFIQRLAEELSAAFFVGRTEVHNQQIIVGVVEDLKSIAAFGFDVYSFDVVQIHTWQDTSS